MFEKLKTVISSTAKVYENYGGYEIVVLDYQKFPWQVVFEMLIDSGFQIWIDKKNSHIVIESKPEVN